MSNGNPQNKHAEGQDAAPHRPRQGFRPGRGPGVPKTRKPRIEPCAERPEAIKARLDHIHAPYNFVPVADWVHLPKDLQGASHDHPFSDGASGEIPFRLIAETPLLIGGERRDGGKDKPGVVHFVQRKRNGRSEYFIPGSSLRGMLRAIVEIAAFGRLRQVDDARYGLRDISRGNTPYQHRVRGQVRAGFLRRRGDGTREIIPCDMATLSHRDLEHWWQWRDRKPIFTRGMSVRDKYQLWERECRRRRIDPYRLPCRVDNAEQAVVGLDGTIEGYPVFTGQVSDSGADNPRYNRRGKYKDMVFMNRREGQAIPVDDQDWRAFLLIHDDEGSDRPWPDYWRQRFDDNEPIPVFYVPREDGLSIGLARMPKLAWDFSVRQLIDHVSPEHRAGPDSGGLLDMADLLFGTLADDPERFLKGRVRCGHAPADGDPKPEAPVTTILNNPKPTYFPNYLQQDVAADGRLPERTDYATCIRTLQHPEPKPRGSKRYPARPEAKPQALTAEQQDNLKVQTTLHPLPAATRFSGTIAFHNLRPAELGALLWAITWGNDAQLRHGLGMGKPFGYGQVRFDIDWSATRLRPNTDAFGDGRPIDPAQDSAAFIAQMEQATEPHGGWRNSLQLQALLAMADPRRAADFPGELRHMRLEHCNDPHSGRKQAINEFVWAKQHRIALLDYAPSARAQRAASAASTGPMQRGPKPHPPRPSPQRARPRPDNPADGIQDAWLKQTLTKVMADTRAPFADALGGQALAKAWAALDDADAKARALAEIKVLWQQRGWWQDPPGRAKRRAKAIYEPDPDG